MADFARILPTAQRGGFAIALLVGFCQFAPAQVSDGKGLPPLEGVLTITDDRALWDSVKDSQAVSELQTYLNKFPTGLFAEVATIRIRTLSGTDIVITPHSPLGARGGLSTVATPPKTTGPSNNYGARLVARIRPNIAFILNKESTIAGNPSAEVEVRIAPDGTILGRNLLRSSGLQDWDSAVLKAIDKTKILPRDVDGRIPNVVVFIFRPKDQSELTTETAAEKRAPAYPTTADPLATGTVQTGAVVKDCADCPEMVVIPAGSFEMGSNDYADERPVHRVSVPGFLLAKNEVTQGQWKAVMGSNPSKFGQCGDDCPVETVDWDQAQEFVRRLSLKTGRTYRLPSEAEWEYAARAGSNTKWSYGDNESQLGDYAWSSANSQGKIHRVSEKKPNAFGLYDMHGNVWEWVEDCRHENYIGAPTDGSAWTTACSRASYGRVFRGGSWGDSASYLRVTYRNWYLSANRDSYLGLRVARSR